MKIFRKDFFNFGGLFFFYFLIWAVVLTFLPMWLTDVAHLNASKAGFVFSSISLVALIYQPFFGVIQDKLVFKKYLFAFVAILMLFMGPFFSYAYIPLLHFNIYVGAIIGSVYLSACFYAGVGVVESYIEKVSRNNKFEYGHVRLFGSIAGATASFVGGILYVKNPVSIFWFASLSAVVLCILLYIAKVNNNDESSEKESQKSQINKEIVFSILKMKKFWFLALIIIGTACIYDVFDQQFPNYYASFFSSKAVGTSVFSKLVSFQTGLEAVLMIFAPAIVNRIGAKNGLILFGTLTFIRIFGSATFTNPVILSGIRLIAAFEMPLLLVSIMKYITHVFDVRFSATVYLLGFNFAKQLAVAIFSSIAGNLYSSIGFRYTYYFLSVVVLAITLVSVITLTNDKKVKELSSSTAV
ncbi:MFS transporter [Clostridium felsineum]|uniref:Lactose permease n=1 Tax=Clostridium felsineum TaxID=36839 RepID=A0A1S8LL45_9CLOT|nr:MFS transporter [Clostridium felsineum]MCR3759122.1 MFS transporter [Clostridium felsineum]URZ00399.1 Lactose permease [Clostridium felsineum]URZ11995.1 Lactose permease [Clostridium felsineum]URZ16529.1 Lactose permease [Clostridium felsineum DSM 794]